MNFRDETGDDPWENNSNYDYNAVLRFEGPGMPFLDTTIVQQLYYQTGCIDVTHSATVEVPTGYNAARIKVFSRSGGYQFNAYIAEVTAGGVPDNDPFCIDSDIPTDSPYTLPSDAIQYLIENHVHQIGQITRSMLNNSGVTLAEGDLVIPDLTHLNAVTTTTDAAQTASPVGIVTDGNIDGQDVVVGWFGVFSSVNIGASTPTAGDYLFTSSSDKEGDVNGTRSDGAVGQLAEDSGNVVLYLWGTPDSGAGGVTEHGDLTGLTDDDHPQYLRTTLGGRDTVELHAAAGSTETLDLTNGNIHDVTLTANCTLTLSGATNGVGCSMLVLVRQPPSGGPWAVTWPGSVSWVGGSAPTLETAANAWNLVYLITLDGGTVWFGEGAGTGGGGGAPTTADYLVGTAQGGLSAEIVVGTTPGGELGGTWASPTVDSTHSGSAHHTESHASRHADAGADPLDVTDLDGFPGGTSSFLRADGTFAIPSGSGGYIQIVRKTADETVNNTTTLQNDDELKFAVAASAIWQFECDIYYTAVGLADLKVTWIGPAGSTVIWSQIGQDASNNVLPGTSAFAGAATGTAAGVTATMLHQHFIGVVSNGATPGDLQLQWAQNTLNASNATVHALSNIRLVQLA
jgi:hypothetical protein